MKDKLFYCILLALSIPAAMFGQPRADEQFIAPKNAVILVIRHAEKPGAGNELSSMGEARAQAYVNYFKDYQVEGQPLKIDYLFATKDSGSSHRPRLTLEPLGKALGLKIDCRFNDNQFLQLARAIQTHPPGTNIVICWHHGQIPPLLRALGADPKKLLPDAKWPDDEFGWLIQLRYDGNGHLVESKRINENLSPADPSKPVPAAR